MSDVTAFDGTRLASRTWGQEGAPVVVLVHGLGLSTDSWGEVPHLLAGDHRVVAYDLRGHARSGDARSGDYSMEAHAKDLDAVLGDVVLDGSAAVVVGNSLGGGIIVARAHHCGNERMAGAVFAGSGGSTVTFPGFPARGKPARVRTALRLGWLTVLRAVLLTGKRIRSVEILSDRLVRRFAFTAEAPREIVARVREDFLGSRPRALACTTLASISHDGSRMAPDLRVPTLVIHGSADPEVSEEELTKLLAALPDGELLSLSGEGHMLPLTRPELVAEQISRWVRHVLPTGPQPDG